MMKIGSGCKRDGLFYLDAGDSSTCLVPSLSSVSTLQWHHRLRHSLLQKLKHAVHVESLVSF